jgi:hypothetical protein
VGWTLLSRLRIPILILANVVVNPIWSGLPYIDRLIAHAGLNAQYASLVPRSEPNRQITTSQPRFFPSDPSHSPSHVTRPAHSGCVIEKVRVFKSYSISSEFAPNREAKMFRFMAKLIAEPKETPSMLVRERFTTYCCV